MTAHSSILAWRIPWTEEPGGLQSIRSQRVGHDRSDLAHMLPGKSDSSSDLRTTCPHNRERGLEGAVPGEATGNQLLPQGTPPGDRCTKPHFREALFREPGRGCWPSISSEISTSELRYAQV